MAGDLWGDLTVMLMILFFIYLLKWTTDFTGSKKIGLILAVVIGYLTFFRHIEILIFVLIFFFGYPFFGKIVEGFQGK